jgi:hypothetical protein
MISKARFTFSCPRTSESQPGKAVRFSFTDSTLGPFACTLSRIMQKIHHLAKRLKTKNRQVTDHGGFIRILLGHDQVLSLPFGFHSNRQRALLPAAISLQRQLAVNKKSFQMFRANCPEAAKMLKAIGRSNTAPSLRIPAGARLIKIFCRGISKPHDVIALSTRNKLSLTASPGNPTIK